MNEAEFVNNSWSYEVKGVIMSKDKSSVVKPMVFAKIQTSKCWSKLKIHILTFKIASKKLRKSEIEEHKEKMTSIGQIEVRVHRDSAGKQSQVLPESEYEETDYSSMIHEKALAKESKSHGTMLVFLPFHFAI